LLLGKADVATLTLQKEHYKAIDHVTHGLFKKQTEANLHKRCLYPTQE
jgi:hypothetical protein